jgi:molybdenum cofactor guanylyltransferase
MKLEKNRIAVAILAGGNAKRLGGIAKGNIEVAPKTTIINRLIAELNSAGLNEIVIVANNAKPYRQYEKPIISDIRLGIGPLGGIESALDCYKDKFTATLFLPCDLPKITAKEISTLIDQFIKSSSQIVFAKTAQNNFHPLCAVVQNSLLKDISAAIDAGIRKVREIWVQHNAVPVIFPDESVFLNVNSKEDLTS